MQSKKVLCGLACLVAVGCGRSKQVPLDMQTRSDRSGAVGSADPVQENGQLLPPGTKFQRASAEFASSSEKQPVKGDARLEEVTNGVRIRVSIQDAPPNAKLGVHVDEKGDCNKAADSTGAHFNPRNTKHGLPGSAENHLGDLGNIQVDPKGNGELLILTSGGNLRPSDQLSFLGRALVIRSGPDDGQAPSGGATDALACAVIEAG